MAAVSAKVLRRTLVLFSITAFLGLLCLIAVFAYLSADLPKIRTLADYAPLRASKVFSDDGQLVGSFFTERRTVIDFASIPQHVVRAFLAAEDANFYEHEGIDYFGIVRAALKNLRPGAHLQGASTITQQTVKTLVLGPERSYARKIREVILARELEQVLSKDEILTIYLNQIYFGSGAWGVEEAAQTYFGRPVGELTLGEGALLAAIPKNPARYNIRNDPIAAKSRQRYVLEQMLARHWADSAMVQTAIQSAVPMPAEAPPSYGSAPQYLEQVRRLLVEKYGEALVYQGGLTIYLGMHAKAQLAATTALRQGIEDLARREGYFGAPLRLEVDRLQRALEVLHEAWAEQLLRRQSYAAATTGSQSLIWDLTYATATQLLDDLQLKRAVGVAPLEEYQRVRAPVVKLDRINHEAFVDLGSTRGRLRLKNMAWARRYNPRGYSPAPKDPSEALALGDLILVEISAGGLSRRSAAIAVDVDLVPEPQIEGALVAMDPHSRLVWALVGGYRQDAAGFNRATQAVRQPGSAFKPVVYAAAISRGLITPASICPDSPVVIPDPWTGKTWKPENFEDGRYDGNITYRTALMRSKNTCSVRLMQRLGPDEAIAMAHAMGITAKMPQNLTLALGTGDTTPLELTNAYATIAAGGQAAAPIFVRKVVGPNGQVLEETRPEFTEAFTPQVAFVLTSMMRSVVDRGTATRALMLDRPLAGKTGTSQESRNVWFSGFAPGLVATVWMGFDNNDSLGYETGSSAALPAWIRFMGTALAGQPPQDFPMPEGVVTVPVDPATGQPSEAANSLREVFVQGTEPTGSAPSMRNIFLEDNDQAVP